MDAQENKWCTIKEDSYYNKPGDEIKDAEQLITIIERGLVNIKPLYGDGNGEINFSMIHKKAYDKVIAEMSSRFPYDSTNTTRESYSKTIDVLRDKYTDIMSRPKDSMNIFDATDSLETMRRWFESHLSNSKYIPEIYCTNPTDEIKEAILDHCMLNQVFQLARIEWTPVSHRGMQQAEYMINQVLGEVSKEIIDDVRNKYDDYDYDDDEDYDLMRESANDPFRWIRK